MNAFRVLFGSVALSTLLLTQGCSSTPKAPDVNGAIHDALKQAGLGDVSVSQDRDKAVVTIKGNVASENDKMQAETIAKSFAAGQVVANEILVSPPGAEGLAKDVKKDLDAGIEKNLDAELLRNNLRDGVKYDVNSGVVTLTGEVTSAAKRTTIEKLAATVPNVQQVVNKMDVKNQKATSTY